MTQLPRVLTCVNDLALRAHEDSNVSSLPARTPMEQILSVGVPNQLVADLTRQLPARIHAATSLGEARLLLRNLDFTSVILDLQLAALGLRQLCELMGEAPLTTRFIALCDDPPELDPETLADMGILFLFRAGGKTLARQIA